MHEFTFDTSGAVDLHPPGPLRPGVIQTVWTDLDAFTQGYIEALFFTEQGTGEAGTDYASGLWTEVEPGLWSNEFGFADLAAEALQHIIQVCTMFQDSNGAALQHCDERDEGPDGNSRLYPRQAGRDFWLTRNRHGAGFNDGSWPEPYASALTEAAKSFGDVSTYLGDDGKVHLR